ncbi:hypothetical protein ACFP3Q_02615 [Nocardioides sp. GCM10027113]
MSETQWQALPITVAEWMGMDDMARVHPDLADLPEIDARAS